MSDKKPANYYGGFSLRRGGNPPVNAPPMPAAAVAQAHARQMAFFNSDWFAAASMPNMMSMFGMSAPSAAAPSVAAATAPPVHPLPQQQQASSGMPFFNLFPSPNFYKGAPIVAPLQQATPSAPKPAAHSAVAIQQARAPVTSDGTSVTASHAAVARRIGSVPHMIDTWHSFDAIAPPRPSSSAHLDPIGTKPSIRSSVWAGTPVADTAAIASSSAFQVDGLKPFSVWNSPTTSLVNVLTKVSSPVMKPKDLTVESVEGEMKSDEDAQGVESDDEADWMKTLQHTLQAVIAFDEKNMEQRHEEPAHPYMAMEWVQRATPAATKHAAPM